MVHGYDTLHRYGQAGWLAEVSRVTRADAPILFPHVHLSNSRPAPFFEREGTIRKGQEYEQVLARAFTSRSRRVFVIAEFEQRQLQIIDRGVRSRFEKATQVVADMANPTAVARAIGDGFGNP